MRRLKKRRGRGGAAPPPFANEMRHSLPLRTKKNFLTADMVMIRYLSCLHASIGAYAFGTMENPNEEGHGTEIITVIA